MQVITLTFQHAPTQNLMLLQLPECLLFDRDPGML